MLIARKYRITALILMLVFFCCHISAAAASDDSRYKVFKSKPWPIEVVSKIPFTFEVSDKYKKAQIREWSTLLKKENKNPTFNREELRVNDPILAAYWKDLFDRLLFAELEEKLTYVNHFMNRFDYGEDINVWGVEDYWATPREYMERKVGDCKAIAIAKYYALRELRVDPANMYLATVTNAAAPKGSFHVVLLVYNGGDVYVLDMQDNKGPTKNSAYSDYTVYDYFNEITCREVIR